MCEVYTGFCGTREIEHGLCACTVDNPLAKARGLSLRTGAQTMLYLSLILSLPSSSNTQFVLSLIITTEKNGFLYVPLDFFYNSYSNFFSNANRFLTDTFDSRYLEIEGTFLKQFEISVLRHIRFVVLRKKQFEQPNFTNDYVIRLL